MNQLIEKPLHSVIFKSFRTNIFLFDAPDEHSQKAGSPGMSPEVSGLSGPSVLRVGGPHLHPNQDKNLSPSGAALNLFERCHA
ncbi:hypothetical protein FIU85_21790 (plasmid) [Roseovarius sp. THAF8]|nr:hypothetical protein FIU85_21790 [Roseovarius sp. THAF8]